ncbi:MAG: (d)CMP kinase [Clostridia bacterium]|nr:(d)CMP kinase [Clostridia bacterium]
MVNIAIDGPSGAGKSTLARAVAKKLGITYIDTGALYRAIGLYMLRAGIEPGDAASVVPALSGVKLTMSPGSEQRVFLSDEDVTPYIRTDEVSRAASSVSAIPEVRTFLLSLQRDIAKVQSVVMDGRDIGTVILPDADVKIFLTASAEKRAERRWKELTERGEKVTYEEILSSQRQRDERDSTRKTAPAVPADDAVLFDNSSLNAEETVERAVGIIEERLKK